MTRKTKAPTRGHEEATIESFRKSPKFAAAYLKAVLDDGNERELMLAFRRLPMNDTGIQGIVQDSE